jgi:hypothetical protein
MSTLELKSKFHALIDDLEDEKLLEMYYTAIKNELDSEIEMWDELPIDLQNELIELDKQTNDRDLLISNEEVFKNLTK